MMAYNFFLKNFKSLKVKFDIDEGYYSHTIFHGKVKSLESPSKVTPANRQSVQKFCKFSDCYTANVTAVNVCLTNNCWSLSITTHLSSLT